MRKLVILSSVVLVLAAIPLVLAEEDEPPPAASGETASGDGFTPTEQLRHDQEVDFPVDI